MYTCVYVYVNTYTPRTYVKKPAIFRLTQKFLDGLPSNPDPKISFLNISANMMATTTGEMLAAMTRRSSLRIVTASWREVCGPCADRKYASSPMGKSCSRLRPCQLPMPSQRSSRHCCERVKLNSMQCRGLRTLMHGVTLPALYSLVDASSLTMSSKKLTRDGETSGLKGSP